MTTELTVPVGSGATANADKSGSRTPFGFIVRNRWQWISRDSWIEVELEQAGGHRHFRELSPDLFEFTVPRYSVNPTSESRQRGTDLRPSTSVAEQREDGVVLDPAKMSVGLMYPFEFLGHTLYAMRLADGSLDFYYPHEVSAEEAP